MTSNQLRLEVLLKAVDKITGPLKNVMQGSSATAQAMRKTSEQIKTLERAQSQLAKRKELGAQFKQTTNALNAQNEKLRSLKEQMAATAEPSKKLTSQLAKAQAEVKKLTDKHEGQRQKLKQLDQALKETGVGTGSYAKQEHTLKTRLAETNQQLQKQQQELAKTAKARQRLENIGAAGKAIKSAGMTTAMHGAAAAYGSKRALDGAWGFAQEGMEFDATMSRVQALARLDKNSEAMQALRAQAKQLGEETMFSANDAAQGQAFLAMAGFTPKAIQAAMPGLLDMALAGGTDLARTADIASNILGGFKLDASQMGRVSDVLTAAFTSSNTSLETLGETMKYVAPVASAAGMGLEEAAAMAGLLGNVGIQGSQAGTTMKAMLLRLAAPAGKAADYMDELGVSATDANGNLRSIPRIIQDVAKATATMGSGERLEYIKNIFGSEPAAGLAELLSDTKALDNYISSLENSEGAAAKTAKTMADNLRGDLDALSSAMSGVKIKIFEEQDGSLRELIQSMTTLVGKTSQWISENKETVAQYIKWAAVAVGVIGALGTLAFTIGTLMTVIGAMVQGFAVGLKAVQLIAGAFKIFNLVLLANPIGLIIAAIAALGAAFYLAYQHSETFRNFVGGAWEYIQEKWSGAVAWATDFIESFKTALDGGNLLEWFGNLALSMGKAFLDFNPIGAIYSAINSLFDLGLPEKFSDFGASLISGLMGGLQEKWEELKGFVTGIGEGVSGWFKDKLGINSPSKVFAEFGENTLEGYQQGLDSEQQTTLKQVGGISKGIAAAGAGLLMTGAVAASDFDTRPPVTASQSTTSSAVYNITINTSSTDSAQDIAAEVERILRQREAEHARQARASLSDSYTY